ncbi:MAG: hypothetical protein AB8F74_15660 [Saprospiraceae bacterium]
MRSVSLITCFLLIFMACEKSPKSNFKPLDLLSHGLPITIQAPENPEVKVTDMTVMKDITVKKGEDYNIQIYSSAATSTDVSRVKTEHLNEVKSNPFFKKVITDNPNGFVYEKQIDSTMTYGFKYVHIQGDQEFIFQNGILGIYSLDQVNNMYDAVQQK